VEANDFRDARWMLDEDYDMATALGMADKESQKNLAEIPKEKKALNKPS